MSGDADSRSCCMTTRQGSQPRRGEEPDGAAGTPKSPIFSDKGVMIRSFLALHSEQMTFMYSFWIIAQNAPENQ